MRTKFIAALFLCLTFSGCSSLKTIDWNPFHKPADIAQPVDQPIEKAVSLEESNPFVDTGRIIGREVLAQGGVMLIIPFRAGPDVESNERLDELGLKMIQGVADELKDYRPYFKIITDEGKETADIILKGFFLDVGSVSKLKDWLPGKKSMHLSIKGQIIDRKSDKPVLIFTDASHSEDKAMDYPTMSYDLGRDIGRFIRSGTSE